MGQNQWESRTNQPLLNSTPALNPLGRVELYVKKPLVKADESTCDLTYGTKQPHVSFTPVVPLNNLMRKVKPEPCGGTCGGTCRGTCGPTHAVQPYERWGHCNNDLVGREPNHRNYLAKPELPCACGRTCSTHHSYMPMSSIQPLNNIVRVAPDHSTHLVNSEVSGDRMCYTNVSVSSTVVRPPIDLEEMELDNRRQLRMAVDLKSDFYQSDMEVTSHYANAKEEHYGTNNKKYEPDLKWGKAEYDMTCGTMNMSSTQVEPLYDLVKTAPDHRNHVVEADMSASAFDIKPTRKHPQFSPVQVEIQNDPGRTNLNNRETLVSAQEPTFEATEKINGLLTRVNQLMELVKVNSETHAGNMQTTEQQNVLVNRVEELMELLTTNLDSRKQAARTEEPSNDVACRSKQPPVEAQNDLVGVEPDNRKQPVGDEISAQTIETVIDLESMDLDQRNEVGDDISAPTIHPVIDLESMDLDQRNEGKADLPTTDAKRTTKSEDESMARLEKVIDLLKKEVDHRKQLVKVEMQKNQCQKKNTTTQSQTCMIQPSTDQVVKLNTNQMKMDPCLKKELDNTMEKNTTKQPQIHSTEVQPSTDERKVIPDIKKDMVFTLSQVQPSTDQVVKLNTNQMKMDPCLKKELDNTMEKNTTKQPQMHSTEVQPSTDERKVIPDIKKDMVKTEIGFDQKCSIQESLVPLISLSHVKLEPNLKKESVKIEPSIADSKSKLWQPKVILIDLVKMEEDLKKPLIAENRNKVTGGGSATGQELAPNSLQATKKKNRPPNMKLNTKLHNENVLSHQQYVDGIYTCDVCKKSFTKKKLIIRHLQFHARMKAQNMLSHKEYIVGFFTCAICDKSFTKKKVIIGHLEFHFRAKNYPCETCNTLLHSKSSLMKHRQTHKVPTNYTCKTCKKHFTNEYSLRKHKKSHSGLKHAKRSIKNGTEPTTHETTDSGLKSYSCNICKKAFARRDYLSKHKLSHSLEIVFSHPTYEKSYVRRYYPRKEIGTSSKQNPSMQTYMCPLCKATFFKLSCLNKHKTSHLSKANYACGICNKSFTSLYYLFNHQNLHPGPKPFVCSVCNESFVSGVLLKEHHKSHLAQTSHLKC